MMLLLKKFNLKRQNGEKFVHIATDILDTMLFPGPYLRGNVIVNRNRSIFLQILCDRQIKAGIINKNHHIGLPLYYILFTQIHILKDLT